MNIKIISLIRQVHRNSYTKWQLYVAEFIHKNGSFMYLDRGIHKPETQKIVNWGLNLHVNIQNCNR